MMALALSFIIYHLSLSPARAQDVVIGVTPASPVLPPQAGEYFANPGKFFTVKLTNNSDEQQLLHIGMHVDMLYPSQEVVMATPANGHIPREPIVLAPRQTKILNPVEMRNLFRHFTIDEIGLRDDIYDSDANGVVGLLPEGQYQMYMQAYKWDPTLTSAVQLNRPEDGYCQFTICYKAQPPKFLTPVAMAGDGQSALTDPLSMFAVAKLDIANPVQLFTWTPPTLNCNTSLVQFNYDVKVVKLDGLMPDEALDKNPTEYQVTKLATPTFTIPQAYLSQWKKDTTSVFAIQVTAHSLMQNTASSLNFSLLENDGKSDVLLFRFHDNTVVVPTDSTEKSGKGTLTAEDGGAETDDSKPYTFEQPTLIKPNFPAKTGRKVFVGDSIVVDWRKAWFASGRGQRQDTIKFAYTVALYQGNSADEVKNIFLTKPIYTKNIGDTAKVLADTIKWEKLKGKAQAGDYLVLRVTAKATNVADSLITMQGDSLNYVDFAMTEHFNETYACGSNTSNVENKKPVDKVPEKGTKLFIGDWTMTLNDDVKQDKETKGLSGTGWINWRAAAYDVRVAVKFDKLMVNSDNIVYDGICNTYAKEKDANAEYTAEQAVDSIFSAWGLDNIWGDLGLPEGVAQKVGATVDGEVDNLAKKYDLGKYYTYFKKAENQWDKWQKGQLLDLYFPTELPDEIKKLLPSDFSLQIANISYSPKGAVMNIIGEYVLPKSDVIDNDVLIFGAPRLCVKQDQFLPEDGVLSLLSNFKIKDPSSDWTLTFKAPTEPLDPTDGCFLRWENDEYGGLGVEFAMTIPNLKRVVDGKVQDAPPIIDVQATIEDNWGDWMGRVSMDPFQVEDLPGWTFSPGKNIVLDHSYERNYQGSGFHFPDIAQMPSTYDPSQVNSYCKQDWDAWQGLYIDEISVQFPKWAVFGKGDEGLKIAGQKMFFDNSGVTCDIAALNMLEAKTGKAGGWEFDLDLAKVIITQNNFDSCHIEGRFGIPLFGAHYRESYEEAKAKAAELAKNGGTTKAGDASKGGTGAAAGGSSAAAGGAAGGAGAAGGNAGKGGAAGGNAGKGGAAGGQKTSPEDQGKVRFICDMRHLTEGETTYYTYDKEGKRVEHKKKTYGEDTRMAYYFRTQQIDSLDFSCFVANVQPIKEQTYFMVTAIDRDKDNTDTYVELNMAAQINIADSNSTVNSIREYAKKLPLNMDFKGIHIAKMRLANFSYKDTAAVYKTINTYFSDQLGTKRVTHEQQWESDHEGRWVAVKNKELALTEKCFLDLGEWSLTSPKKKIGPFSVELKEFKPDFNSSEQKVTLSIEGVLGLMDDKVSAGVGIDISSYLTIPSDYTDFSGYDLSWGGIDFRSIELKADFGMLKMDGRLDVKNDDKSGKGYAGKIGLELKELFTLDVEGGYFNHKTTESEKKENDDLKNASNGDDEDPQKEYAWGYFTADVKMDAKTSPMRFDPLVITRISGGFYYNCRPVYDKQKQTFGTPENQYGMLGLSFGMGMAATAGEETLSGDMDLNVIYDRANHHLSTFAFKGNVKAVSGIVDANMMLLYQNDATDRFLSLDITAEAGFSNGALGDKVAELNKQLENEKKKLDKFQEQLDDKVKQFESNPLGSLTAMNSDYESTTSKDDKKTNEQKETDKGDSKNDSTIKSKEMSDDEKKKVKAGEAKFSLNMLVTWRKDGVTYNKPKWHLYLGEPEKDKRCKIVLLDFKSSVVSVDIGADAYLCLGNELPNNGQLPPIPSEISDFLNGGSEGVNTSADMAKAENSRSKAVREMLGNVNGGVMVGASAWGYINVDLGLFYDYLKALAGFDMSLVNYGDNAFCVNLHKTMGRDGWYAMGQFYAYLAAKFGLHIKLGKLINKRIDIIDAGIGGVFECGLPSPTWIEGRARVKLVLLDGLVKINKKFQFECGDRCEAFLGNALDDFNLFDTFTLGSDSLLLGWQPQHAVSVNEAKGRAMFNTTASLNSQYRLVDPSTLNTIKDDVHADSLFNIHAARTYIFNLDEKENYFYNQRQSGIKGVRLFEFDRYTDFLACFKHFNDGFEYLNRQLPSFETSTTMAKKDLNSTETKDEELNVFYNQIMDTLVAHGHERLVKVRDKQGMKYHLSNMDLQPGKLYMLVLTGTAYEVLSGQRYWCEMVEADKNGKMQTTYQKWIQHKFFFFGTKEREEVADTLSDFSPYVALAYPAPAVGKLFNDEWENAEAYTTDILHPTIALKEDIRNTEFTNHGKLQWKLNSRQRNNSNLLKSEVRDNVFIAHGNCINMEPDSTFSPTFGSFSENNPLVYNLQLVYSRPSYASIMDYADSRNWKKQLKLHLEYQFQHNAVLRNDTAAHAVAAMEWLRETKHLDPSTLPITITRTVLADMWFRNADRVSWQQILPSKKNMPKAFGYTDPLPYERPFIGVRPPKEPTFNYPAIAANAFDPYTKSEDGYIYENMDEMRLKDPYAYFSYLSNWVFIGGRAINKYNFDDIPTPHASETLTFSYNSSDVAAVSQIEGLRTKDAFSQLRDQMYGAWNDWYYNNPYQPQYPLPTRLSSDYDATFGNQDGKASAYYTPWNENNQNDQWHYGLTDFYQNFMAPYYVAEVLSDEMESIANDLYGISASTSDGDKFNQKVKNWSNLHRGQYLTVESRGYQVRVPYYQFPLIFGDACVNAYDPVNDHEWTQSNRGFGKSLGESNIVKARWKTYVSNLFWWRLVGGYLWKTNSSFDKFYTTKYYKKKNRKYVEKDDFSAVAALNNIKDLQAYIYRVNSYDISTGLYTVDTVGTYSSVLDIERAWWGPRSVGKSGKDSWSTYLQSYGTPDVYVNGKLTRTGSSSSNNYANMDTTPDAPPTDDSGTREGTSGQPSRGGLIGHSHMSPTEAANAAIYTMLRAKAQSSVAEAATFLLSIKKQDESLYSQLLEQLLEEMPEIKTQLMARLNAAENMDSLLNQLGGSIINLQDGTNSGNKRNRGGASTTLGGGSSSSSTGSSSTSTGSKSTVESLFSPKKRNNK